MIHELLGQLDAKRKKAIEVADECQIYEELLGEKLAKNCDAIREAAFVLELFVLDHCSQNSGQDARSVANMRRCAADAFRLYRALPDCDKPIEAAEQLLRMCSLAVVGDVGADAVRLLRSKSWQPLPLQSTDWRERTWSTILEIWLRLIRKDGWEDRDVILEQIKRLRDSQSEFEDVYLGSLAQGKDKIAAIELIAFYHLAKAAEILAIFVTDGVVEGNYQVKQLLDTQFDRVFSVCNSAPFIVLEPLSRLLSALSLQMIENSIWTVTRAVNSRVTQFVKSLVDRGRGDKAIFDVLPPQRRSLAEEGLLGSSRRAVVVSLPTSSGKTLIAQFRILQALNQFDHDRGWVAYLAPTRTLVNQIARQLRRDFGPLKIVVEQVSPALEIDGIEMDVLEEQSDELGFRVLVTTPEKLDLLLRQGWEKKIKRPLTLVVVDEAHNIQDTNRGLRLELLLSTINKECKSAQFLLLTPFIQNAAEIARWLGGNSSQDISLSVDWQPNDRVIGIVQAIESPKTSSGYSLQLETVHTTRHTLCATGHLPLSVNKDLADTYREASNGSTLAALAAQSLRSRGPVIVMHSRPDWVWKLASRFQIPANYREKVSAKIKLVQDYVRLEFGDDFPLVDLLSYRTAVHHSGLPDELRTLIEWLVEQGEIDFLVATTTVAQGVNFPVSGVVMASHEYLNSTFPYRCDMPPEDFWNIAGRAGRIGQGQLGVVVLVAKDDSKAVKLREFINKQSSELNSALISMVLDAKEKLKLGDLEKIVYTDPEWSSFLQYLAHTYSQMEKPETFIAEVEQLLRGTLGFESLRSRNAGVAQELLDSVYSYCGYLQRPNQPLKLVDSTGFSLQSVVTILTNKGTINKESWDGASLFSDSSKVLQEMMGVLLRVPELRQNLSSVVGNGVGGADGGELSAMVKDWVNGKSLSEIAGKYFPGSDKTDALTKCGKSIFGNMAQNASWGLGALLAITGSDMSDEVFREVSNLPSRVFYGVNTDGAIILRLLGVPRTAATRLSIAMPEELKRPIPQIREILRGLSKEEWQVALGNDGAIYRSVWRVLEGLDN